MTCDCVTTAATRNERWEITSAAVLARKSGIVPTVANVNTGKTDTSTSAARNASATLPARN